MRGPILHRLLEQFLADVWWGDLDVLLMDLPPGTGDVAISAGQLIPGSDLIVVTTPLASARGWPTSSRSPKHSCTSG